MMSQWRRIPGPGLLVGVVGTWAIMHKWSVRGVVGKLMSVSMTVWEPFQCRMVQIVGRSTWVVHSAFVCPPSVAPSPLRV